MNYCGNCGINLLENKEDICPGCGSRPKEHNVYCHKCGEIHDVHKKCSSVDQDEKLPLIGEVHSTTLMRSISFFAPVLGIILYIIYRDRDDKIALELSDYILSGVYVRFLLGIIGIVLMIMIGLNN